MTDQGGATEDFDDKREGQKNADASENRRRDETRNQHETPLRKACMRLGSSLGLTALAFSCKARAAMTQACGPWRPQASQHQWSRRPH